VILVVNESAIDHVVGIRLADAVEVIPALLNRLRDFGGALRALLLWMEGACEAVVSWLRLQPAAPNDSSPSNTNANRRRGFFIAIRRYKFFLFHDRNPAYMLSR
jgi:hypothetical protein